MGNTCDAGWRRAQLCDLAQSGLTDDAAGNVTADGLHSYQWDAEGRLISVNNGAGTLRSYVYNALGRASSAAKPQPNV